MRQRNELLATFLIDPDRVPLAEGAAAAVLPGQADVMALGKQGTERQGFRRGDVAAAEHRLARQLEPAPAALEPIRLVRQIARSSLELFLKMGDVGLGVLVDPGAIDNAFLDQALGVDFRNGGGLADRRLNFRAGEARPPGPLVGGTGGAT